MAEQSFLNKLGMRLGILGSSAALAWAAPLSTGDYSTSCHTDAARIGMYFDRTAAAEKMGIIVGGQTGPLYTRSGTVVNAQFTGVVTVGDGTVSASVRLNGAAATNRYIIFQTAGVNRWTTGANNTAEGGANSGSDYTITAYTDAGAVLDIPFTITRAAGGAITTTRTTVINSGASGAALVLTSDAATNRSVIFQTAGSTRWIYRADNAAEAGTNAGSNFSLDAYSDAGAIIDSPLSIVRAALGAMTIARPVTQAAGILTGTQILMSSSATWNNAGTTFVGWFLNITDTNSAAASLLLDLQTGSTTKFNITKTGKVTSTITDTDLLSAAAWSYVRTSTLTGNVTDGICVSLSAVVNGAFTVTRFNYISVATTTGTSTVTNGCVLRFNANPGTHKAVDAATTKTTPGGVDAWMKHNVNGTVYFQPLYLSKTA